MKKKFLIIILIFSFLFPFVALAKMPDQINIPESSWLIEEKEPHYLLGSYYKLRWYGDCFDSSCYTFPVITVIPDIEVPNYEEIVKERQILEFLYLYNDLIYNKPSSWFDANIYLKFDKEIWLQRNNFWNLQTLSWDPKEALLYATGLYSTSIAATLVTAYAGNLYGLLGTITTASAIVSITTNTLDFIANIASYQNSEELIKFAVQAIGNLNIDEKNKLEDAIDYINYISSNIEQISTGGKNIYTFLLAPGTVGWGDWISIKNNLFAASHFGWHSQYGKIALTGTTKIIASHAVLSIANFAVSELHSTCGAWMINIYRNANLHTATLAALAAKIVNDIETIETQELDSYSKYELLLVQIIKNMQLYYEVKHEFFEGTSKLLNSSSICSTVSITSKEREDWEDHSSIFSFRPEIPDFVS